MRYVTAKKPADIKLHGIHASFEFVNDSLKVVTLKDANGGVVRFAAGSYEAANVTVPAPPKMEKRYVLRGELPVVGKIERAFEQKHEADEAKRTLQAGHGDFEFLVSCEEVEIKDDPPTKAADGMPF
jgi:hypothetical protein